MRILSESRNYILGHEYEQVFLVTKASNIRTEIGDHYGDPTAGMIGPDESWFVSAGEGVLYFDFARGIRHFLRDGLRDTCGNRVTPFVFAIRLESPSKLRILLDPWSEYASVWLLDTKALEIGKLQDGPSLVGLPYQENVDF